MSGMRNLMCDHPAWTVTSTGTLRAFGVNGRTWAVSTDLGGWQAYGSTSETLEVFQLVGDPPAQFPTCLAHALAALGPVARWRNPSLWDAIATAIIRQVIRAGQARLLYQQFCSTYGAAVDTPVGIAHVIPDAATVASLPAGAFAGVGMAFKQRPLQAAAEAYLDHGDKWAELPPSRLVEELQAVPRIGPWTAGAAVADYCHDWTLYPYGDLAVRKWAAAAAPDIDWPGKEEPFAARWRQLTGDQLGLFTVLTLAWGGIHGVTK